MQNHQLTCLCHLCLQPLWELSSSRADFSPTFWLPCSTMAAQPSPCCTSHLFCWHLQGDGGSDSHCCAALCTCALAVGTHWAVQSLSGCSPGWSQLLRKRQSCSVGDTSPACWRGQLCLRWGARCALCRPCSCWEAAGAVLSFLGAQGSGVLRVIEHPKVEGTRRGH